MPSLVLQQFGAGARLDDLAVIHHEDSTRMAHCRQAWAMTMTVRPWQMALMFCWMLLCLANTLTHAQPMRLDITHGLSGSGKTTVTQKRMQTPGAIRLRSDVERKRLAGLDALAKSGSGVGRDLYAADTTRRTYAHLARLAGEILDAGWPIIVDATFTARWQRDLMREAAHTRNVEFRILDFPVPVATLRERVVQRSRAGNDASEADLAVLQHQLDNEEPLDSDEQAAIVRIDA
mgnify:CR=1 FL=1